MVARPVPVWCGTTISAVIAERNIEEVNKPAICARRKTNQLSAGSSLRFNTIGLAKRRKKIGEKRELCQKKKKKNERQGKKYAFPCAL